MRVPSPAFERSSREGPNSKEEQRQKMCASARLRTRITVEANRNKVHVAFAGKGGPLVSGNEAEFGTHSNLRDFPVFNFDQD